MSTHRSNDENVRTDTEAYYETIASQEEIYLEEREEEVREVLTTEDPSPSPNGTTKDSCTAESLDEQLTDAAEELITGDSDDPPLSLEEVGEMLNTSTAVHVLPRVVQKSL